MITSIIVNKNFKICIPVSSKCLQLTQLFIPSSLTTTTTTMRNDVFPVVVIILLLTPFLPTIWSSKSIRRHKRIIGGEISTNQKWTYVAILESRDKNDQWYECSATIISSRHILTAAHCVTSLKKMKKTEISIAVKKEGYHLRINRLGINDVNTFPTIEVHKVYAHLHYNHHGNDIAILEANETLFADIKHVKLASNFKDVSSQRVMVMGFGDYDDNGNTATLKSSNQLREIETFTHTYEQCKKRWNFVERDIHVCVGKWNDGIASGDSGGPMLAQAINGEYYQIGVASWGGISDTNSENNPSIFMNISKYCTWIEKVTKQMVKCHKVKFMDLPFIDKSQNHIENQTSLSSTLPNSSSSSQNIWMAMLMISTIYAILRC